jgi:hypothetical protein
VLTAAPAHALAPDPPTNVTAEAGDTLAVVNWTPPVNDGGSPIVKYRISSQPGTDRVEVDAPATNGVFGNLTNGIPYTFTVRAINADGISVASEKSNEVIPGGGGAATAPGAPTNVQAEAGDGGATVSWTAPDDGGSAITGYRINIQPGTGAVPVDGPQTSTFVSGLTNGGEYTFTVRAINMVGSGPYSTASNPVVPGGTAATVPDPPTNVTAVAGNASALVSWTPPANDGGAPVTRYRINVNPGGADMAIFAEAPATSVTFPGLTNGVSYTFNVKAINLAGWSAPSLPSPSVKPAGDTTPAATTGKVYGIRSNGDLYRYSNNGASNLVYPPVRVGGGWTGYLLVSTGDFNGDSRSDLLARKPNGDLMFYRGNSTGGLVYPPARIGGGWNIYNRILSPGDLTGDRRADLLVTNSAGELKLYRGDGTGDLVYPPVGLGGGWNIYDRLVSTGDFTGDGRADVLARKPAGDLMLYHGNGNANLVYPPVRLGGGWNIYDRLLSSGDLTADGRSDLIARKPNGDLMYYRGTGNGKLVYPPVRLGGGWTVYGPLVGTR